MPVALKKKKRKQKKLSTAGIIRRIALIAVSILLIAAIVGRLYQYYQHVVNH